MDMIDQIGGWANIRVAQWYDEGYGLKVYAKWINNAWICNLVLF